jgi:hypothetical protein
LWAGTARSTSKGVLFMKDWISLTIVVALLTGWLVGCARASSADVLIEYRRSGGFAGLDDHLVIKENGQAILTQGSERHEFILNGGARDRLEALFAEAEFSRLRRRYLPSRQGADLFEYVVTYKGHTVRTMDGAVPSSLQPILGALNEIVQSEGNP